MLVNEFPRSFCNLLCVSVLFVCSFIGIGRAAPNAASFYSPDCDPITGCPPVIAATEFQSHSAFAFNNGITSAVVVPNLGRVMAFGLGDKSTFGKSTFNWLWNNKSPEKNQTWKNWGGEKTWLAPQSDWLQIAGAKWPPDPSWTKVIQSEVQTGGFLKTTSAVSSPSGIRFIKQYGHDESGDFFIRQTAEKVSGKPLQMALWNVTQINPPDAVFFLLNPSSKEEARLAPTIQVQQLQGNATPPIQQKGDLACYIPSEQTSLKFGINTSTPVLAALHQNQLFVLRAKAQNAIYPDATQKSPQGFSLEIFDSGVMPQRYLELEIYSPLRSFHQGSAWTFTVKWNVYQLPDSDLQSAQLWDAIEKILKP